MKEFVPRDEDTTSELSCSVCLRLLHHPKEIVECGHMFCEECIPPTVTKCPMCRCTKMTLKTPNRAILRLLEMSHGYCGCCGWQGSYEQYMLNHERPTCADDPEAVKRAAASAEAGGSGSLANSRNNGSYHDSAPVAFTTSTNTGSCSAAPGVPLQENGRGRSSTFNSSGGNPLPFSPSAAFPTIPPPSSAPSSAATSSLTTYGNGVGLATHPQPAATAYPTVANYPPTGPSGVYPMPTQGGPSPAYMGAYPPPQRQQPTPVGYPQQQQPRPQQPYGAPTPYAAYPPPHQSAAPPTAGYPQYQPSAVYPPQQQQQFPGLQPTPSGIFVDGRGRANTLPVGSGGGHTSATGSSNVYFNPFGGGMLNNPHPTR